MATHRKRRQYTTQQRQDFVEQFGRSGLEQAEFCRRAKLHPMTFSIWRRKQKARRSAFAEVQVSAPVMVTTDAAPVQRFCTYGTARSWNLLWAGRPRGPASG